MNQADAPLSAPGGSCTITPDKSTRRNTYAYLAITELEIYFVDQGDGESLLFLPDNFLAASAYQQEINHLAERFHVIAPDYAGRGDSGRSIACATRCWAVILGVE